MKLQCKVAKCGYVVDTSADPIKGAAAMVAHVKGRHISLGMSAIDMATPYLATHFFVPVVPTDVPQHVQDNTRINDAETYNTTRKTLLKGFKEWCEATIK